MEYLIRRMAPEDFPLLEDFLYEAIFVPEAFEGEIPRSVVFDDPKCRAAFEGYCWHFSQGEKAAVGAFDMSNYVPLREVRTWLAEVTGIARSIELNYLMRCMQIVHSGAAYEGTA